MVEVKGNEVVIDYTENGYFKDEEIVRLTLPELKGSKKQIAWAQDIRAMAMDNIVSSWTNRFSENREAEKAAIKMYGSRQKIWEAIIAKCLDNYSQVFVKSNKSWEIIDAWN